MKINKFITQSPLYVFYLAQCHIIEPFQRKLASFDVHFLQALILTAIFFEEKEVRPRDLQKVFSVEASNLSHSLRGLEKKGYLKRSMHPTDSRGYLFNLTPLGKKRAISLIKEIDLVEDQFEGVLGNKKTKDLVDHISQLICRYRDIE